jgi:coenzyme F420-0:L-glutamate ligase / coenzyme F420-1:gamma-L-glutamate ligase
VTNGSSTPAIEIVGLTWPEVRAGDALADLLICSAELFEGDIVVVTSKVVSKAEGRAVLGERADVVPSEAVRVLARRGDSVIAETRHGLVMAAAGVDSSNTTLGSSLLLPLDPDGSARVLRESVYDATGRNVAVVITDTAGRAWRNGQVDLAIGCAGLQALTDLTGTIDPYGNELVVTSPATADEIASAADLVKGKTAGRPVAILRGLAELVLAPGTHGRGAAELVRPSDLDLFGLGAREAAVAAALRNDRVALAHFPPRVPVDPPPFDHVRSDHDQVRVTAAETSDPAGWLVVIDIERGAAADTLIEAGRLWERCAVIAAAYRLTPHPAGAEGRDEIRFGGAARPDVQRARRPGWDTCIKAHWILA